MVDEIFLNKRKNVFINYKYEKKELMTQYEQYFYNVIRKRLNHKYIIIPQVNLATIVNKKKKSYCNELFRNIDFGIFDKKFNIKLLIEVNDKTHLLSSRMDRDKKIKNICKDANVPIIFFYSKYCNKPDYIIKRILDIIEED